MLARRSNLRPLVSKTKRQNNLRNEARRMYSLARLSEQPNKRTPEKCLFSGVLAHLRGFEPLAYRLGVVNTVSSFVTGFHSQYQKTPVVRRLWVYYLTRFHIVSQGKIRVLLCLVCKLCAGKGGCTLSDKDS